MQRQRIAKQLAGSRERELMAGSAIHVAAILDLIGSQAIGAPGDCFRIKDDPVRPNGFRWTLTETDNQFIWIPRMRIVLLAQLISTLPMVAARAGDSGEDDFDAAQAIKAFFAEGPGCGGTDVDGSKLDPEVQDRRCAVMNAWAIMLEDHGYCFDEDKQEWKVCAATN